MQADIKILCVLRMKFQKKKRRNFQLQIKKNWWAFINSHWRLYKTQIFCCIPVPGIMLLFAFILKRIANIKPLQVDAINCSMSEAGLKIVSGGFKNLRTRKLSCLSLKYTMNAEYPQNISWKFENSHAIRGHLRI